MMRWELGRTMEATRVPDRVISTFELETSISGACLVKNTSIVRGEVVGIKKKTFLYYLE